LHFSGGVFNRTVTVHVGDRYMVTIQEEFPGRDALQNFRVKTYLVGTLPDLPENSTIDFGEFTEDFTRATPGNLNC